ncbi:FxsA family protein [Aureimonas ureilytica]|uniref:FxsA family protein n=1 Tax=Aureimonas ureilytica TaxID=401562 RepID=UPI000371D422|nr:FxsA family protein [Aureimonas ureilytica]
MPLILVPIVLLAMPLLEIGAFIWVGGHIGIGWTLLLVILSVVVGASLLKRQTLSTLRAAQAETRAGRLPEREIVHGAMITLAGILLIIPGFLSDIVGLALFLPPVRDLIWRALRRRIVVVGTPGYGTRPPTRSGIVDLTDGEFARRPDGADGASPWVRLERDEPFRGGSNGRDDKPTLH